MYMRCLERLYICRQETNGHLYGKGDGKVHYNRRQNKGWGGVSQIKKMICIPLRERRGYVSVFGEEIYAIQKTKTGMGCCN